MVTSSVPLLLLLGGALMLAYSGSRLVDLAAAIAEKSRLTPAVIGLTVVAAGTSAARCCEVNAAGETLRQQRFGALEATALLRTVIAEIDVAVFAFDVEEKLRSERVGAVQICLAPSRVPRTRVRPARQPLHPCRADAVRGRVRPSGAQDLRRARVSSAPTGRLLSRQRNGALMEGLQVELMTSCGRGPKPSHLPTEPALLLPVARWRASREESMGETAAVSGKVFRPDEGAAAVCHAGPGCEVVPYYEERKEA